MARAAGALQYGYRIDRMRQEGPIMKASGAVSMILKGVGVLGVAALVAVAGTLAYASLIVPRPGRRSSCLK